MKIVIRRALALCLVLLLGALFPALAAACATCGCGGVGPVAMMEEQSTTSRPGESLSDSIWGSMILKMAYARDPELKKLSKRLGISNTASIYSIAAIAGGAIAQSTASMALLNPADGLEDSYAPGIIGLALNGATNIAFSGRMVFGYKYRRQMKKRKQQIKNRVELILNHLEFSKTTCAEARKDLTDIIGERAAEDCVGLWQSCHVTAELMPSGSAGSTN